MLKSISGYMKRKANECRVIRQEITRHGDKAPKRELDVLLLAHSLEKGLSMKVKRKNWGSEKAQKLLKTLATYAKANFAYSEAMSVLEEYFNEIKDEKELYEEFSLLKERLPFERLCAGVQQYYDDSIDTKAAVDFLTARHSIRAFKNVVVNDDLVRKVAELTNAAPSACNRQPSKIYYSNNSDTVMKIDNYIPGNKGIEGRIPNWAFITTDREMFTKTGYMQWYVNGGIFTAYFVLALHAYGLGSCIFQVPIAYDGIDDLKQLVGIPENEAIIAAVGFGFAEDNCEILASSRKSAEEFLIKID